MPSINKTKRHSTILKRYALKTNVHFRGIKSNNYRTKLYFEKHKLCQTFHFQNGYQRSKPKTQERIRIPRLNIKLEARDEKQASRFSFFNDVDLDGFMITDKYRSQDRFQRRDNKYHTSTEIGNKTIRVVGFQQSTLLAQLALVPDMGRVVHVTGVCVFCRGAKTTQHYHEPLSGSYFKIYFL